MASSFDTTTKFRDSGALIAALAEKAKREGTTQSALIRRAVRRELEDAGR